MPSRAAVSRPSQSLYAQPRSPVCPPRAGGGARLAVKGEGKLAVRVPLGFAATALGVLVALFLPGVLVSTLQWAVEPAVVLALVLAAPLAVQGPFALALPMQRVELLKFLERCGPETEIVRVRPFSLRSYVIELKTTAAGAEHHFLYGYTPFAFRGRPHVFMTWPTLRKGISIQNKVRFNNFSKKFNTMEFSYLRSWSVRLYLYPVRDDYWWFDLYLFHGSKATNDHLFECYQIALETKDKLTRSNPAF